MSQGNSSGKAKKLSRSKPQVSLPPSKKKKSLYKASPSVEKIDNLEAARCGINPLSTTIPGSIVNIDRIAAAIVGQLNHAKGAVPVTGTVYNAGAVSLYLNRCLYAYMVRCGVVQGDTSFALNFAKFRVPTLVAVAFQHCAPYYDSKLGNTVTLRFDTFTSTNIDALVKSESLGFMWVLDAAIPSYGGETTFSAGASVTAATYTDSQWAALSDWISAGFETVPITEIGLKAPSHYGIVARSGSLLSIKPIVGAMAFFGITSGPTSIGPHAANYPPVRIDASPISGTFYDETLWGYGLWSTAHVKYSPGSTFGIVFKRQKINPLFFNLHFVTQSMPKMALNVLDFMVQIGALGPLNSFTGANMSLFMYLFTASLGRALASSPFFCHFNGVTSATIPQYSSPLYLKAKIAAYEVTRGWEPTRSHDTVICPWFSPPTVSTLNCLQVGSAVTANWGDLIAGLNSALGNWPFSATIPTYTIAGQPPVSASTYTNVVPLRLIEEMESTAITVTGLYANNTLSVSTSKEFCPCGVVHVVGANSYTIAPGIAIVYPLIPYMWCTRAVDTLSCKMTVSASCSNADMISLFWQPIYDVSQNPVRPASEASYLTNNVFNFNMAGASPGDLAKSVTKAVSQNLLGDSEKVPFTISGKQLIKSAQAYLSEGGVVSPPPPLDFWSNLPSVSMNLFELISKTASGIQYLTPAAVGAVQAAKILHTYKPLLSLV